MYKVKPRLQNQFNACDCHQIPLAMMKWHPELWESTACAGKVEGEGPGVTQKDGYDFGISETIRLHSTPDPYTSDNEAREM